MSIHLRSRLALAACLVLVGSVAEAAPKKGKKAKQRHEVVQPVETQDDADDDVPAYFVVKAHAEDEDAAAAADDADDADDAKVARAKRKARHKRVRSHRREAVVEDESDEVDPPVAVRKHGVTKPVKNWHFAIGPNMWAASVDAKVAVGGKNIGTALDFMQLSRSTRYGVPLLAEARYKRFSLMTDLLYAVVDVAGGNEVGGLMVTLNGSVSTFFLDGLAGYRFYGDDESLLSLEARAGIRYQRTVISGSVGLGNGGFSAPEIVSAGSDMLAGARVVVRPLSRLHFTGTFEQSLVGESSTWSAGAEANVRIASWLSLAAGYRTMTQQSGALSTVMHGPRAALQLEF